MRWQPISEAPKDGTEVFLWVDGKMIKGFYSNTSYLWVESDGYAECQPTDFLVITPPGEQQPDASISDLAMLVRRLCRAVHKWQPDSRLVFQALGYLRRKGIEGSPFRDEEGDTQQPENKFEEAAAIRRGERDDDMPDYEVLTGWIQRLPMTWLPGLLVRVAAMCVHRGVYREGGIEAAIERAKALGSDPTSEVLRGEQQPESVNQRLLDVCNTLVKWAADVSEDALLKLDNDPHPPSWMSVIVDDARAAIEAAKQATKGTDNANQ